MSSPGRPSTSSIDIRSLDADLSRFRSQLDQWADQVVARTVAEKDNHLRVQGKLAGASLPACSARVCDSFSKETHSKRSVHTPPVQRRFERSNGSTKT